MLCRRRWSRHTFIKMRTIATALQKGLIPIYWLDSVISGKRMTFRKTRTTLTYTNMWLHGWIFTLHASCGAVYCNRSCLFVGVWLCLWVCYHDNSKLRISILIPHQTGSVGKGIVTISSWLNFGRPAPPGRGTAAGKMFGSALLQPVRSVCVSSERFFH